MADKARDLQFRVLSDLSKLDLDKPARDLDQLGDAGRKALDDVQGKLDDAGAAARGFADDARDAGRQAGRAFSDTADDVKATGRATRDYADDARDVARKVVRAFDDISDASRKSSKHIDDDLDDAKHGLGEFKDEAKSSGREAAASFGGGFDDITSFVQETAANAFGGFGPLGAAAGIAAAAGIGIITKVFSDSKEKAEEAKASIGDWVQAFIDGQGKIQEATIAGKLKDILGDPDQYKEIIKLTGDAGVSASLYARTLAGDTDAARKLSAQLAEQSRKLAANNDNTAGAAAAAGVARVAIDKLAGRVGSATGAVNDAKSAWNLLDEATRAGITADVEVKAPTERELRNEAAQLKGQLGKPINVPVKIDAGTAARVAWLDADRYFRNHPITLRTKAGARPVRDVP